MTKAPMELPALREAAPTELPSRPVTYARAAKIGAVWALLRQGGHELIALPSAMVLARLLSPADFGIAAAASFFIVLATRLTQLGFNSALVKIKELRDEHVSSVFVVNLVLGVLTWGILTSIAPLAAPVFKNTETVNALRVAALIFLVTPFGTVPSALIARRLDFRSSTTAGWIDTVLGAVVAIALGFQGFGFWSIVIGHLAGSVGHVVTLTYLSRWRPRAAFSVTATRDLLSFGLGVHIKRLLQFACFNMDNLIVGTVLGVTALGYYDKAFTTMNRVVGRLAVGHANFRIFSIIQEDQARFRRAYLRLIFTVSLMGLPVFGGAMVAAPALFTVLFGDGWQEAVLPFQILCAGGMLKLFDGYASQANEALGGIWAQVRRQGLGAVLVVSGALLGSHLYGVVGAAMGVSAAIAILSLMMQSLIKRIAGLTWGEMLKAQVPAAVGTVILIAVMAAAATALHRTVSEPSAWQILMAQGTAGGIFYVLFLIRSPFTSVRDLVWETVKDLGLNRRFPKLAWLRGTAAQHRS